MSRAPESWEGTNSALVWTRQLYSLMRGGWATGVTASIRLVEFSLRGTRICFPTFLAERRQ